MSINKFITNLDLSRQAEILSGETAVFQGGIELGIPFSGFPSGVDTSTIVSLGIVGAEFAAFSGNTGTTIFNVTDPSSTYYSVSATTLSASPYTIIDSASITETVSATTYPTIMTFTALSGDCCSTPISVSFTPPIIQELYDRGLYDGLFNGLGQATIGTTYIDESFYNVGSVFSGANLDMEIVEYGAHGTTPAWVTGTTSGTVIEYSALTQYWTDPIYENLTSGLTLPITPESADTQTSDYVWTLTNSTIIDENLVGLQYTGYSVTYSFNDVIIDPESPSITGGVTGATSADTYYLGTVTATLENYSAGTLDYKGTTNWLTVNGSATIDERLTTDRLTIHTLGTGSPVTMLGVDVNGNVVGGSGSTTDATGAFTSTTANNTIIPTNTAGNSNDSDYASILAGQNNTISGTSTSASIVGGEQNTIESGSTHSSILGGAQNTMTLDSRYSSILGGAVNVMTGSDASSIIGGEANQLTGNTTNADGSMIIGSSGSKIYDSGISSIISSNLSTLEGGSDYSSIIGGDNNVMDTSDNSAIIGGVTNVIDTSVNSGILGGVNNNINNLSNRSAIIGGYLNTITSGHTDSVIAGGTGNTIHFGAIGNGEAIVASNDSTIMSSNTSTIISSVDSGITGNGRTNIFGSVDAQIYGNDSDFHSGNLIMGVFDGVISGATIARRNMIGASNTSYMIGDGSERLILGSASSNLTSGNISSIISSFRSYVDTTSSSVILGSRGDSGNDVTITGSSSSSIISSSISKIYDSNDSSILGGEDNFINNSNSSVVVGGTGNTINIGIGRSVILGGQGITATADDTVYMNKLYVTDPAEGNFYTSLDNAAGAQTVLSGTSDSLSRMSVISPNVGGIGLGVRGESETTYSGYGKQGDGYIYSTTGNNGINIISAAGTGTDDYIKFYAGGDTDTLTNSDLMIVGSGSSRGNVGIGTDTPTEKLDVNGNTIVSGTLNIGTLGGGSSVNNLGIDTSGNVVSANTGSFLAAKSPEAIVTHSLTAKGIPDGQVISGYTSIFYNNTDISGTLTTPFGTFDNTTGLFTTNTDCVLNIQAYIHLKANTSSTTAWETGATPTQIGLGICPNNTTDVYVGDFLTILPSVSRGLDISTGITLRVLSGTTFRVKVLNQTSRAYPGPGVVSGDYMRFSITRVD